MYSTWYNFFYAAYSAVEAFLYIFFIIITMAVGLSQG